MVKEPAVNYRSPAVKQPQSAVNNEESAVNKKESAVNYSSKGERKRKILEILSNNEELKSNDISEKLGIKISTTKLYLAELVAEGKIGFTGTFRNRTYHIIKK